MTIGAAWDLSDPKKPVLPWDPDANIVIPFGVDGWLTELGTTYGDHSVIADAPLECASEGTYSAGIIGVRMKLATGATFAKNKKYPFTLRIIGADTATQDDRTFYLKVGDR